MATFVDTHYEDVAGNIHFLSAQDLENASAPTWPKVRPLPDPSWRPLTTMEATRLVAKPTHVFEA